tara:strand:- start:13702 stop:14589 length:888 start_codon:yes stop_codon:yes gene_type:complete
MGNPFKAVKKAVKKVTGGIKKVFSGVKKIGSKVVDGLRSVGREVKRFAKTGLGKVVIAAALIYVGGAALLASGGLGGTGATMSFASALASPGAVVGQLGIGAAGAGAGAGAGSGAGAIAGMTGAEAAAAAGVSSATMGGTAGAIGLNGGATLGAAGAGLTTAEAAAASGLSSGLAGGGAAVTGGAAAGSAAGGGLMSEGMKYGAMMMGGNAISGAMQAKGAAEAEKEAEKARQRYIDGNVVPDVNFDDLAGLQYNPMTGQSGAESTEAYLPENLRVNTNLNNRYTSQGLLSQGAS